jgi:hypothetical protein
VGVVELVVRVKVAVSAPVFVGVQNKSIAVGVPTYTFKGADEEATEVVEKLVEATPPSVIDMLVILIVT